MKQSLENPPKKEWVDGRRKCLIMISHSSTIIVSHNIIIIIFFFEREEFSFQGRKPKRKQKANHAAKHKAD